MKKEEVLIEIIGFKFNLINGKRSIRCYKLRDKSQNWYDEIKNGRWLVKRTRSRIS